ncbi:hypothetical protein, partial [Sphingomonas sp. Leaf25]|uniref:hypothetical protein n=1 Tax=Sphingomonas sp. Leaf25 TaxID=1735692 RepID=UPI001F2D0BA7
WLIDIPSTVTPAKTVSVTPDLFRGPPGRERCRWCLERHQSLRYGPRNKSGVTKERGVSDYGLHRKR